MILGMHLAEGVLPASHAAVWGAVAAPFLVAGIARWRETDRNAPPEERALVLAATVTTFGVTLFPLPVPFLGISSHLCATPVLALLVGARTLVVPTFLALLVQALFFAHGGLTTLGANVVSLGVVGPVVAVGLVRLLRGLRLPLVPAVGLATAAADAAVYLVDAVILAAGLAGERTFFDLWRTLVLTLAPVQGPLAVLEGVLSALLVRALLARRANLVPAWLHGRAAVGTAVLLAASLALAPTASAGSVRGLDEVAFQDTAVAAGRNLPTDSEPGEIGTALAWAVAFAAGVVFGRSWTVIFREPSPSSTSSPRHASRS
jgi:cobalt/nickel transport system permease protein